GSSFSTRPEPKKCWGNRSLKHGKSTPAEDLKELRAGHRLQREEKARWSMLRSVLGLGVFVCVLGACAARPLVLESYPTAQLVGESGWMLSGGGRDVYYVHRDKQGDRAGWLLEPARDTFGKYGTW